MSFKPETYDLQAEGDAGEVLQAVLETLGGDAKECSINVETKAQAIELSKRLNRFKAAMVAQYGDLTYSDISCRANLTVTPPSVVFKKKIKFANKVKIVSDTGEEKEVILVRNTD